MTQLLISVKNVEEALLALACGADIIDLKDPSIGVLGALDIPTSIAILAGMNNGTRKQISGQNSGLIFSATVGENHKDLNALIVAMEQRATMGQVITKIAVSALFNAENFFVEMCKLSKAGVKIVAVFFADERVDLTLLPTLKQAGFYGAMLDTKNKHKNLLQTQTIEDLALFTHFCHQHGLKSGLAGSLYAQHIDTLLALNATYMGFRGGVCNNYKRNSNLSGTKIVEVKKLLFTHNNYSTKTKKIIPLALHS